MFLNFYATCRYNGEFNTIKVARVLFFINELGDSFYLKKELYFIQAQLCGPAIHGPQGINVLSSKIKFMLIPVVVFGEASSTVVWTGCT